MNNPQFPDYIKHRITNDFLTTFKEQLETIFYKEKPEQPTYWNYYQWLDSTCGLKRALKTTCEIHNFKDLFYYLDQLEWYDSDILESRLTEMMYEYGIIEEGNLEEAVYYPFSIDGRY